MKRRQFYKLLMIGFALLTALFRLAGPAEAAAINAIVVFASGDVQVKRAGGDAYSALSLNDLLYVGDEVKTGASSMVTLATKGGAEIRINENSFFNIESGNKVREMLHLLGGQLWTRMLHKMASLDVKTPTAVCAVRGTEADIEQRNLLTVKVYEGHVDVENSSGKQSLKAGEMSTVANPGAAPAAAREMSSGEIGSWQDGGAVKDIQKFLDKLAAAGGGDRKLKLRIDKDGKTKDVVIKLKKK